MAPPLDPPSAISLRIKVPPGHISGGADEFRLGDNIPVISKIGQIRERIQEALPSSPTPERQRLLYGGRALVDNEQTLADALYIRRDPTQTEYVVHLLVKGDGANSAPVPHVRGNTPTQAATGAPQQTGQPPTTGPQQPHVNPQYPSLVQLQAAALADAQRVHQQFLQQAYPQFPQTTGPQHFATHPMHFGRQPPPIPTVPRAEIPDMTASPHSSNLSSQPGGIPASGNPTPEQASGLPHGMNVQPGGVHAQSQPNGAQPRQPPSRPISNQGFHMQGVGPNGERITVHQQTMNIPHAGFRGMNMQSGSHFMPPVAQMPPFGIPHLPGLPIQGLPRPNGPSALDRARENIAEMRRMIDELRASSSTSETQQHQISELETRTQALNDYIDPFHLGNIGNNRPRANLPQTAGLGNVPAVQVPLQAPGSATMAPGLQQRAPQVRQAQQHGPSPSQSDVTCYLLSSPTGPQAILYSPQHGTYTGSLPHQSLHIPGFLDGVRPTPTVPGPANSTNAAPVAHGQQVQVAIPGQAEDEQQAQQQPMAGQDPLAPVAMGVMFNHMWLLLRILIFSYFLSGANLGWRRPLALLAIGIGFWLIRTGLLGDGGVVRRWWDGIMNEGRPAAQNRQNNPAGEQGEHGDQPAQAENGGPARMPTPEEVAQRLLDEDARVRNERFQNIRDHIRPVERAVALLVASLWPGVGEQFVRAREQEERRRAEEEIAARRREEEERQQREEEAKKQSEETAESSGKDSGDASHGQPSESSTDASAPDATPSAAEKSDTG